MEKIEYLEVLIYVSGDGFKPESLLNKFPYKLEILASSGTIAPNGRYKGKPSPFGLCFFEIPNKIKVNLRIKKAVKLVKGIRELNIVENLYITDSYIHLFFTGYQGCMSLSAVDLNELSTLKCPVLMDYSYIKPDEIEERKT